MKISFSHRTMDGLQDLRNFSNLNYSMILYQFLIKTSW